MRNGESKIDQVARSAINAIRPIIYKIKNEKGELPEELWQDEFFLGFVGFLIERNFRLDVSRSERGFIMSQVFGALAGLNGAEIAKRQTELLSSNPRSAEFEKGVENASICMLASIGEFNDRVLPHFEEAEALAATQGNRENRNAILEILFKNLFYDHIRQSFNSKDIDLAEDVVGQFEAVGQGKAAVLAVPASEKLVNRDRHKAPRPRGRAVRNSSERDDQPVSDQHSTARAGEPSLREANGADAPPVSQPSNNEEVQLHIAELEAQVQEFRSRGDHWQKAAKAATAIQARLNALEDELEQLRGERDDWASKAKTAQAASDDGSRRVAALEAELANLRAERDGWQTATESARTDANDLRHRFFALSADLDRLRDERDALVANADAAQETLADLRQHVATLRTDLDSAEGERESLMAMAEAGKRARQEKATQARALRREITVNWVAALIILASAVLLIFSKQLR